MDEANCALIDSGCRLRMVSERPLGDNKGQSLNRSRSQGFNPGQQSQDRRLLTRVPEA